MKIIINESQARLLEEGMDGFDHNLWTISQNGINFILEKEQFSPTPYKDGFDANGKQLYSVGYGHQIKSYDSQEDIQRWWRSGMKESEARKIFGKDIIIHVNDLTKLMYAKLKNYYIDGTVYPQGFKYAIISMIYNMGQPNFKKTGFFQKWQEFANPKSDDSPRIFSVKRMKDGKLKKVMNVGNYNILIKLIKTAGNPTGGNIARRQEEFEMANVYGG